MKTAPAVDVLTPSGFQIYETIQGDSLQQETLLRIHADFFPQFAKYVPYMHRRMAEPAWLALPNGGRVKDHWWTAWLDDKPVGFIVLRYTPLRRCGIGMLMAVYKEYRNAPVGSCSGPAHYLLSVAVLEQLSADAAAEGDPIPYGMVGEVETPRLTQRYLDYGFIEFKLDYLSPPFIRGDPAFAGHPEPTKEEYTPTQLGIFPNKARWGGPFPAAFTLPQRQDFARAFLVDYYQLPEAHWAVQQAVNSLEKDTWL